MNNIEQKARELLASKVNDEEQQTAILAGYIPRRNTVHVDDALAAIIAAMHEAGEGEKANG